MSDPTERADLAAVPLFPLPNVVLFPGAVLPLHIFEQRYREMTADALRGARRIAMAMLRPGWEHNYHGKPAIEPVVCVGTILSHERLADGRYNILLQGQTRARIVREIAGRSYRVAELSAMDETPVMEIDLAGQRRRLIELFEQMPASLGLVRQFRELLARPITTAQIADLIAFNFLEDIGLKQSLLSDPDVRRRVACAVESFQQIQSAFNPPAFLQSCAQPSLN